MEGTDWMEKLMETAQYSRLYQEKLEAVKKLEPAFLALRDSLPKEQQQILEDYCAACDEMDHELLSLAEYVTREMLQEEIYFILEMEATYKGLRRKHQEKMAARRQDKAKRERTPEYLLLCRQYNETARRIMMETGEELPLVELEEEEKTAVD